MNSNKLFEQIHERVRKKSTEELLLMWRENDHGLWSDEVFKAIEEILTSRKVPLPAQGQIKKPVPQSQPLGESLGKPFISWAFYVIFLLWIVVFHPFFFVAGFFTYNIESPLHPDLGQSLTSIGQIQDIHAYVFLLKVFSLLELSLICLGYYAGYLLVEKKFNALTWTKRYISLLFSWLICSFFIYKFYPFAEAIIQAKASVIDLPLNWEILFKEKVSNRASEYAWIISKIYMPPIVCTIVWFIYFAKSKWIAERIPTKP